MSIIEAIRLIPDAIWSALLASLMTLAGVFASNRHNRGQLEIQLKHDATEKDKDRKLDNRREVYLLLAEEMVNAGSFLGGLAQSENALANIGSGTRGFFAAATQAGLIAESKTAHLLSELVSSYGELTLYLTTELLPIEQMKTDIKLASQQYDQANLERQRVLNEMTRLNETGVADLGRFDALKRSFETLHRLANEKAEERAQLYDKLNLANSDFAKNLMQQIHIIGPKTDSVLIALREELGVETDIFEFKKKLSAQREKAGRALNGFLEALVQKSA